MVFIYNERLHIEYVIYYYTFNIMIKMAVSKLKSSASAF
ncbi:hypothetical protein EHF_0181 [Ehrlichia japonica]|uniref:Uncharacterized protein n=1 Tax=Ehrlichia japonica TaxID=391036 RepID=X5GIW5_9RICK|nr:hypothetical protein EHF_0181 [Ehrlichia japonica]